MMRRIDWRTRGREVRKVDPAHFCEVEWPERLAETGRLAGSGAARLGLVPLALSVGGNSWTLAVEDGVLSIFPGDDRAIVTAELDTDAFCDLVDDQKSTLGIAIAGRAQITKGSIGQFVAWEPALRAALDARPVYEPGSVDLRGLDGAPLDVRRSFQPDASLVEQRHFLQEAGFLRIVSLFSEVEMRAVAVDLERALQAATPEDETSWWVRTDAGEHRPSRILDFIDKSDALRSLFEDARFLQIGDIAGEGHLHLDTFGEHLGEPAAEGLVKPLGVSDGISDLPWHKDCARGGHSRFCCGLTVGISVTGADQQSGELCVVAGSHRANLAGSSLDPSLDLPQVSLSTRAGDVTVHCSCTLHRARPPVARERMVVYTGFGLPPRPGDTLGAADLEALKRERGDISRQARNLLADPKGRG